jgi:alpha-amylase
MLAAHWASVGITDVLFPNPMKTQSGDFRTGDGYGPTGDYDIGSKMYSGAAETRFGSAEQLRRAIAICHANGLHVHLDIVLHQLMGGHNGTYAYLGADGKTKNGRFPKHPSCFRGDPPRVPEDPVPDSPDDFSFGDELCPVNALPKNYVWDGLIAQNDWLFRTTDAQGARLDDMKGIAVEFMKAFMTSKAMNGKFYFGEYASGNRNDTEWWVNQVDRLSSASDFDLHYNVIMPMCNDAGNDNYQMNWMTGRGMMAIDPMKSVTFVESMDSDTNGFATVVNNKELGYALLLTCEGFPQIYVRDYLPEPACYGLQPAIDNLCWIHNCLANGGTTVRYGDAKVYVYERTGYPNLLVALNNDVWNPNWHIVTVQTGFGPFVQIHDYTGHNDQDYWTDASGRVTIWVPPGANGRGYSCWSRAGLDVKVVVPTNPTSQTFFGAYDLDIPQAKNLKQQVGRIWVAAKSPLKASLIVDQTGWTGQSQIVWQITDPNQNPICNGSLLAGGTSTTIDTLTTISGWYTIWLTGVSLPVSTLPENDGSSFSLTITYTAPRS